jgi:hypothetical protein
MRLRAGGRAFALGVLSAALGAGLVACFDLFHSTSGIVSSCDVDAQACRDAGPQADGPAGDAGTDFCSGGFDAVANAQHACAWLGACETPKGNNAFGTCMFNALLAYDCSANPNHLVRGKAHALWDCLWQVQTCAEVTRCIFPEGLPPCQWNGTNFTACGNASGLQGNADVRIECIDVDGGLAVGENCALTGQTCSYADGGASCTGAAGFACPQGVSACASPQLQQCSGNVDVGIDCASNGAGACGGFPTAVDAGWVACVPGGDTGGDSGCTPSLQASCTPSGYATSCPSGVPESVYCPDLLQTNGSVCVEGPLSPTFDWTSACMVPGGCTSDSCDADGGVVVGCARGASYPLDCASQLLGPCQMVITDVGAAMHAACTAVGP